MTSLHPRTKHPREQQSDDDVGNVPGGNRCRRTTVVEMLFPRRVEKPVDLTVRLVDATLVRTKTTGHSVEKATFVDEWPTAATTSGLVFHHPCVASKPHTGGYLCHAGDLRRLRGSVAPDRETVEWRNGLESRRAHTHRGGERTLRLQPQQSDVRIL